MSHKSIQLALLSGNAEAHISHVSSPDLHRMYSSDQQCRFAPIVIISGGGTQSVERYRANHVVQYKPRRAPDRQRSGASAATETAAQEAATAAAAATVAGSAAHKPLPGHPGVRNAHGDDTTADPQEEQPDKRLCETKLGMRYFCAM